MIIRFDWELNLSLMDRVQREGLIRILDLIQSKNKSEIEVIVVFFPVQFLVKVDSDKFLVCWNFEKSVYKVMKEADAIHVLDQKTNLISLMSVTEFERISKRRKK